MIRKFQAALIVGAGAAVAAGCAPVEDAHSAVADRFAGGTGAVAVEQPSSEASRAALRFVVASSGNEVRYRVREQLAGFDLPNDAVGKSVQVTGAIAIDDAGRLVSEESRFAVDASTFVSDRDRRDNYVRGRLLQASEYPTIAFIPTALKGVTLPPARGTYELDLVGDLTVRGVTRPITWRVAAKVAGEEVTGSATTKFVFTDFSIEKPRVRSVLSVADTIALEYDFRLVREMTETP
jgi:polyisoprenoid-binding protein YceI